MKNKAIKLITTLLLSIMTLNYIGTTVFAVKYSDELGILSSVDIAKTMVDESQRKTVYVDDEGTEYIKRTDSSGKTVNYQVVNGEVTNIMLNVEDKIVTDSNGKKYNLIGNSVDENGVKYAITRLVGGTEGNTTHEYNEDGTIKTETFTAKEDTTPVENNNNSGGSTNMSGAGNTSSSSSSSKKEPTAKTAEAKQELSYLEEASKSFSENGLGTIADGIVGLATITLRLQAILIGFAAQSLATLAGTSAGSLDDNVIIISPDQILFNRLAITDINFFQTDSFGTTNKKSLSSSSPVKAIRENIAKWYYALRTIALIILLVILIYIGIRMAMSTVASEKAVYKQWLWNWLVSMALLFVLHFFILLVINVNNAFVDMLYEGVKQNTALASSGGIAMDSYVEGLIGNSLASSLSATGAWSFTLVYLGIALLTMIFLIMYIMRMIRIAFLILIAPIITITYSIDKLKDNAAQALNAWVRQFCEAVLIQPFHCIIYLAFISTAISCIHRFGTLAAGILTILCMWFIFTAEKMVKEIFGIKTDAAGNGFATAAVITGLMSKAGGAISKGKKTASNVKGPGKNSGDKLAPITANSGKASNVAQQNMNNANSATGGTSRNSVPIYGANGNVISRVDQNPNVNQKFSSSSNTSGNGILIYGANGNVISRVDQNPNVSNDPIQNALNNAHNAKNPDANNIPLSRTAQMATNNASDMGSIKSGEQEINIPSNEAGANNVPQKPSTRDRIISGIKAAPAKAFKLYNKTQIGGFGTAMGITAAMATGMSGKNAGEIIAGGIAGKAFGSALSNAATEYKDAGVEKAQEYKNQLDTYMMDRKIKNSERELATAYNNYKNSNNYSHEQMENQTRSFSQMSNQDIGNMKNEDAKAYARALKAMPNIYAESGNDDPNQELADTLKKIQNGQIKPKENNSSIFGFSTSSQDKKRKKIERFRENEQKMNEQRNNENRGNEQKGNEQSNRNNGRNKK